MSILKYNMFSLFTYLNFINRNHKCPLTCNVSVVLEVLNFINRRAECNFVLIIINEHKDCELSFSCLWRRHSQYNTQKVQ